MEELSTKISDLPDSNTSTRILNELRNDDNVSIITTSDIQERVESNLLNKELLFDFILSFLFGLAGSSKILDNALLNVNIFKKNSDYVIFVSVFILTIVFTVIQKILRKYYF